MKKLIKYYYSEQTVPKHLLEVVEAFEKNVSRFDSEVFDKDITSNFVLESVREDLENLGYKVESGKKDLEKIIFRFITKSRGEITFHADAYNPEQKTIIEVEAGRAVVNNQFLKDLYQASAIKECDYLVIAVKKVYRKNEDFDKVAKFIDGIFPNPLVKIKGVLVIGY